MRTQRSNTKVWSIVFDCLGVFLAKKPNAHESLLMNHKLWYTTCAIVNRKREKNKTASAALCSRKLEANSHCISQYVWKIRQCNDHFDCLPLVFEWSLIIAGKLRSKCCRKIIFCDNQLHNLGRKSNSCFQPFDEVQLLFKDWRI